MSGEGSSSDLPQSWKPIGVMPTEMGEDVAACIEPKKFTYHLHAQYLTISQGRARPQYFCVCFATSQIGWSPSLVKALKLAYQVSWQFTQHTINTKE